ncbi:Myb/SANT-like domain-containing protein [Dioscorea alata]|uniref:Myb/SANT-like domain-containing protein n=1 Tax=Dioscorea alata TaxID=55571 RepID=A0ACB7VDU4_DIOAL|nr:Myb/SANT-like domain-containing protein [Dioscorea alata]
MKFPNLKCTIVQVKALEQELKKIYKLLKGFTELSGFGWDNEKNMVEATEEVWAPLLERNKKARRWHQKPFPYFTSLREIYEGRYAEGRRSRDVDYYSNVPMDTPSPSIPAPNDPIESLSTPEIETEDRDFAQREPPCSQPYISQPQTSCSAR